MTPRRAVAVAAAVLGVAAALSVAIWATTAGTGAAPSPGTDFLVPPDSSAARAAESAAAGSPEAEAAAHLAGRPTAVWLTPETSPVDEVGARVTDLIDHARAEGRALALVVYGLPGRDCGGLSAGGLAEPDYRDWVGAIGEALDGGVTTVVVLEPDSLALAPECGNVAERQAQLSDALAALTSENVFVYLDGGHSRWLPPAEMADLIAGVAGRERARGFATNVSNSNDDALEIAYAHEVAERLGPGAHAVIDTSRNGSGSTGEWCNAPGRTIGAPAGAYGDDVVDTNLWIKPPGESDGPCNGGAPAGEWMPPAAVELTRDVLR